MAKWLKLALATTALALVVTTAAFAASNRTPAKDTFVVGAEGTILYSQKGSAFVKQESGTTERLRGVWGASRTGSSAAKNVYAVGDAGTVLHFDGVKWAKLNAGVTVALSSHPSLGPEITPRAARSDQHFVPRLRLVKWDTQS